MQRTVEQRLRTVEISRNAQLALSRSNQRAALAAAEERQFSVYIEGQPDASEIFGPLSVPKDILFSEFVASAGVASTGTVVFQVQKIAALTETPTNVGTVTFTASLTGVVNMTDPAFDQNTLIQLLAPATVDPTLANIQIILRG